MAKPNASKLECFIQLAKIRGVIGYPSPSEMKELGIEVALRGFLTDDSISIEFDGPLRDVELRAYWDDNHGGGGCIAIPKVIS